MRHTSPVHSRQLLALAGALLLAACATPMTNAPNVTQAELQAEQAWEQSAALSDPFPPIVEPVYPNKKMKARLAAVSARVNPQAVKLCNEIRGLQPDRSCSFHLMIQGTKGVNAYADGKNVVISAPMMVFADKDTYLAFVLAHELSHNIMEHQKRQGNNVLLGTLLGAVGDIAADMHGANTQGAFGNMGAQMAQLNYSPSFEAEADYIGLYILARAGYPIEQAPNFWRAMAQYEPQGIYARSTHPTNPERFVAMKKTIEEIRAKQRAKQPLLPNPRMNDA